MIQKTFRLFISSTFSDFKKEREILNSTVAEELEELCQSYGYDLQFIDLRWGVTTDSSLNQQTMEICLNEVHRCLNYSPKPNFLMLIGDRYGWIPLPSKIDHEIFDSLYAEMTVTDQQLISEWYLLDDNALKREYCLRVRTGEYTDDDTWQPVYEKLIAIFSAAARKSNNRDEIRLFDMSATEQEIYEGFFASNNSNSIAFFRSNSTEKDTDPERVTRLKTDIRWRMEENGLEDDLIQIDYNNKDYYSLFRKTITEKLKEKILNEIIRLEEKKSAVNDREVLSGQYQSQGKLLFREKESGIIDEYVKSNSDAPLLIYGESGSGKSRLLAEYAINHSEDMEFVFFGLNETSCDLLTSLRILCQKIITRSSSTREVVLNYNNSEQTLYEVLRSLPRKAKLTLIMDAVDMFYDIDKSHGKIFPKKLPEGIKLIVSYSNKKYEKLLSDINTEELKLEGFDRIQSIKFIEYELTNKSRRLTDQQWKIVKASISEHTTPLMLKLICDNCVTWKSWEKISETASDINEMAIEHIEKMFEKYGHPKETVLFSSALILSHPYGVTEKELLLLLMESEKVREEFKKESRYTYVGKSIPFAIWSRLFFDLKICLNITLYKGDIAVKFYHNAFRTAFQMKYKKYYDLAFETLCDHYLKQHNYINPEKRLPNKRKSSILTALLLINNNFSIIKKILSDAEFIDSAVKNGDIDNLMSLYYILIKSGESDKSLIKLFDCLKSNITMLRCYKNNFLICCYERGLFDSVEPIAYCKKTDETGLLKVMFPYSAYSITAFSPNFSEIAVGEGNNVYIYSVAEYKEKYMIFHATDKNVKKILWLGKNIIVVVFTSTIFVYKLFDDGYQQLTQSEISKCNDDMVYIAENDTLYFFKKKKLCAFSLSENKKVFEISSRESGKKYAGIYQKTGDLFILTKSCTIDIYNAVNGSFIKKIKVLKNNYFNTLLHKLMNRKVRSLENGDFLVNYMNVIQHYVAENRSFRFIHLPYEAPVNDVLFTDSKIFVVYNDRIMAVDISNEYNLGSFLIDNVISLDYDSNGKRLFVMNGNGLFIIQENMFANEGLSAFIAPKTFSLSLKQILKIFFWGAGIIRRLLSFWLDMKLGEYSNTIFHSLSITKQDLLLKYESVSLNYATDIVFASSGHKAVAYEGINTIVIYYPEGGKTIIDGFKFSPFNAIQLMMFSYTGKTFLIYTNRNIYLIDTEKGRCPFRHSVSKCIVTSVEFKNEDLYVSMENDMTYHIICEKNRAYPEKPFAKKTENGMLAYQPYYSFKIGENQLFFPLYDEDKERLKTDRFRKTYSRIYYWGNRYLLSYEDGEFFLRDSEDPEFEEIKIDCSSYNFEECRKYCEHEDVSRLMTAIREKNEHFNEIYEMADDRYIILFSRLFNSMIVIDAEKKKVIFAYKLRGTIAGVGVDNDSGDIIIYSPTFPNKTTFCLSNELLGISDFRDLNNNI